MVFDTYSRRWYTQYGERVLVVTQLVGHDPQELSALSWFIFLHRICRGTTQPGIYAALPYLDQRTASSAAKQKRHHNQARDSRLGAFSRMGLSSRTANRIICGGCCIRGEIRFQAIPLDPERLSQSSL